MDPILWSRSTPRYPVFESNINPIIKIGKGSRCYQSCEIFGTDYSIDADGDNYTFMCSKMSDKVRAYIDDYVRIYDRYMAGSTQILNNVNKKGLGKKGSRAKRF